jgi:hypothetical protein
MATKLGALWEKQTKNGDTYFAGEITHNGVVKKIVVFKNQWKKPGENKPDWVINESEPINYTKQKPQSQPKEPQAVQQSFSSNYEDDDIPF